MSTNNQSALDALYGTQNEQLTEALAEAGQRLARELSQQFDMYYANPAASFHDDRIAKKFYEQRLRHLGFKPYPNDGLVTFGASWNGCDRQLVFKNAKIRTEKTPDIPFRGRQRRVGSAVIEYFQLDIAHMRKRLGDDALFEFATIGSTGEYAMEDAMQVRQVIEHNGIKFAITAKPDGIFNYNAEPGRRFLFEYKTKASGVVEMNAKLDYSGAQAEHLRQVTAEAIVFGIDEGFIVYESMHKPSWFSDEERKNVPKTRKTWRNGAPVSDIRVEYFRITDGMKRELLDDLARQAELVYNGEIPEMTVDMTSKCGFCPFKTHCKASLTEAEISELMAVEARLAGDTRYAGKRSHADLANYLAD